MKRVFFYRFSLKYSRLRGSGLLCCLIGRTNEHEKKIFYTIFSDGKFVFRVRASAVILILKKDRFFESFVLDRTFC
ncbi:hypothetical protein C4Q31_16355 [Leptospira borgpetersenii serovar Ceylonica]|nr:hypothetical protein C4Q31_16355 [Leptospira borgpetersenii serovar Ceylonica]KGE26249.1 hypothetical protein IQ66_02585 [Leptospira borgpetersenii serovar Ballum]OOV45073.1 hypothetical protein B1H38_05900 [Leptospira borgpetersenii serovar Ballum]